MKKFLLLLVGGVLLAAWLSSCSERAPLEPQSEIQGRAQETAALGMADLTKWGNAPDGKLYRKSVRSAPNYKSRLFTPQASQSVSLGNFESGTLEGWNYDAIYSVEADADYGVWVGATAPPIYIQNPEQLGYESTQGLAVNASPGKSFTLLYKDFTVPAGSNFQLKFAIRWKNFPSEDGFARWEAPTSPPPTTDGHPLNGQDIIIKLVDGVTGAEYLRLQASDGWALFSAGANPLELIVQGDIGSWFEALAVPVGYEFWTKPLQVSPAGRPVSLQIERYNTLGAMALNLDEIELVYDDGSDPEPGPVTVAVDIMPGSDQNPINLKSKGVIPVAILGTATFDATTVDGATVRFAGASPSHGTGHLDDVNGDGRVDWLCHFKTQETDLQEGQTSASLTGKTKLGQDLQGSDSIQIPKGSSKGK